MIVKGTKQLGSFKRGINIYVPKRISAPPAPPIPSDGLSLWLKADAGVSKFSYNYASQIVISGTSDPSFAGTYTADGVPTWDFEENRPVLYFFTGPAGKTMSWSADDNFFLLNSNGVDSFYSYDGVNWIVYESYVSEIVITGFTGIYIGANGTYTSTDGGYFTGGNGNYFILSGELRDIESEQLIATAPENYSGSWAPANYISSVTLTGADTTAANGTYTRTDSQIVDAFITFFGSGGKKIHWNGDEWLAEDANEELWYLGDFDLINWTVGPDGTAPAPTGSVGTSARSVGSPTSTSSSQPSGSISGSVTTTTVNTDNVTAWADQSGSGNNATATDTPTLSTVDGKTFIDFAGGYFTGNELITAPYVTIMCVARYSDYQEIGMMFQQFSEADNLAFYRGFSDVNNFRIYNGVDLSSSSNTNSNETYLFGTTVNNDTGTLYLNATEDGNGYCGEITPAGAYYLGRWVGSSLTTTVLKMAEIVVYNRVLTTVERQQVEAYLMDKYAIAPAPSGIEVATTASVDVAGFTGGNTTYNGTYTKGTSLAGDPSITTPPTDGEVYIKGNNAFVLLPPSVTIGGDNSYDGDNYPYEFAPQGNWTISRIDSNEDTTSSTVIATNPSSNNDYIPTTGWNPSITITAA